MIRSQILIHQNIEQKQACVRPWSYNPNLRLHLFISGTFGAFRSERSWTQFFGLDSHAAILWPEMATTKQQYPKCIQFSFKWISSVLSSFTMVNFIEKTINTHYCLIRHGLVPFCLVVLMTHLVHFILLEKFYMTSLNSTFRRPQSKIQTITQQLHNNMCISANL